MAELLVAARSGCRRRSTPMSLRRCSPARACPRADDRPRRTQASSASSDPGRSTAYDTEAVEPLGPGDLDEVERFYAKRVPGHLVPGAHARDGPLRRHPTRRRARVRRGGPRLVAGVGCCGARQRRDAARGPRHGLATAACARLCRILLDDGIDTISLNVRADNDAAIRAYEKLGFAHAADYVEVDAFLRKMRDTRARERGCTDPDLRDRRRGGGTRVRGDLRRAGAEVDGAGARSGRRRVAGALRLPSPPHGALALRAAGLRHPAVVRQVAVTRPRGRLSPRLCEPERPRRPHRVSPSSGSSARRRLGGPGRRRDPPGRTRCRRDRLQQRAVSPGVAGDVRRRARPLLGLPPRRSATSASRVLVVGAGNSGAEIALDIARAGASDVLLAVRTPPAVVRRDTLGVPSQLLGIASTGLPVAAVDRIAATLRRVAFGELSDARAAGAARSPTRSSFAGA